VTAGKEFFRRFFYVRISLKTARPGGFFDILKPFVCMVFGG
jgi:hypothetical protein